MEKSHYNLSINVINILEKRIKTVKDLNLTLEEIQKYIDLTFIKLNDGVFINHNNIRYCQAASICYPLAGLEYELMKKLIMRSEFLQDEIILERVTIHGAVCFMYKMELNMYIRYNGELWSKIRDYKAKFDSVTNVQQKETQTEANSQSDDLDCGFRNDHIIRTIVELIQKRQQEEKEGGSVVVYKDNRDLKIDATRDGLASKYCKLYSMYGKLEVDGKSSKEQKTNRSIQNDQSFIQIIDGHYNKNAEKINQESVIYYKNDKINNRSFDKQVVGLNISSRIRGEQKTQDRKKTRLILKKNTLNGVKTNKNAPLKKLTLSPLPKYKKFNNQLSLESAKQSSLDSKKYKNNKTDLVVNPKFSDSSENGAKIKKSFFSFGTQSLIKPKRPVHHHKILSSDNPSYLPKKRMANLFSIKYVAMQNTNFLCNNRLLWDLYSQFKAFRIALNSYLQNLGMEKCMMWDKIKLIHQNKEILIKFLHDAVILRNNSKLYKAIGGQKCDELLWSVYLSGNDIKLFNLIAIKFISVLKIYLANFINEDLSKIEMQNNMFQDPNYFVYFNKIAQQKLARKKKKWKSY